MRTTFCRHISLPRALRKFTFSSGPRPRWSYSSSALASAMAAEVENIGASNLRTQNGHLATEPPQFIDMPMPVSVLEPSPEFVGTPKTVSVIGAPFTYGQPLAGTDHGPQFLRENGLLKNLISLGWRVDECGDVGLQHPSPMDPLHEFGGNIKNGYAVGKSLENLYREVKSAIKRNTFALTLGGDHSLGAGSLAGVLSVRPETGVIWVDAHADLNSPDTSPSGNVHGMPVSMITKGIYDWSRLPGFEWLREVPMLEPEQIVFVGLRDLDAQERKLLKNLPFKTFTMHDVDRHGIGYVMEQALDHLQGRPLHMSYDIDACDPAIAPSTGTTVCGGFNYREAHYIAEIVGESGRLGSLDMVEVNPKLGEESCSKTLELGNALIASAMGSLII